MKIPWSEFVMGLLTSLLLGYLFVGCTTYRPLRGQPEAETAATRAACRKEANERKCMETLGYEATSGWEWLEAVITGTDAFLNPFESAAVNRSLIGQRRAAAAHRRQIP